MCVCVCVCVCAGEEVEPAPKRLKAEENILGELVDDVMMTSLLLLLGEDPDELEVYGPDVSSGPTLASYKFEVIACHLYMHCAMMC